MSGGPATSVVPAVASTRAPAPGVERFLADFEGFERSLPTSEPKRLRALRRAAIERFSVLGFPLTSWEDWRFTSVAPIAATPFRRAAAVPVAAAELERWSYPDCHLVVMANGRYVTDLARLQGLPAGVTVASLAAVLAKEPGKAEELARHASFAGQPFTALNTAFFEDGVLIHVPRGVVVERPINVVFASRPGSEPAVSFPRLLVVAEESSQLCLIEQYVTVDAAGDGRTFACPVTEIAAHDNAVVEHYKLQRESTSAYHMATMQIWQARDTQIASHSLSWGGALVRTDVNAVLDGEGGDAVLNGLYVVEGQQLVDFHMRVEHAKPHCSSHELFKGILEGRSRAVFNGRIYVHPGAQKTDAKQTNRNLLLGREALVNSNPQLEIFADDVKCTHGSTVGQLDPTAVFYLRSRGIGEEAARSLLTWAFTADIVERIRVPEVRRDLEEFLFRRLPKGDIVRQAV